MLSFFKPGLIIDAFGELRDQQEQVKEDMEVSDDVTRPPVKSKKTTVCSCFNALSSV